MNATRCIVPENKVIPFQFEIKLPAPLKMNVDYGLGVPKKVAGGEM